MMLRQWLKLLIVWNIMLTIVLLGLWIDYHSDKLIKEKMLTELVDATGSVVHLVANYQDYMLKMVSPPKPDTILIREYIAREDSTGGS